jgi:uncharacterized membrane protein YbhN (UPF0104 family)
VQEQGRQNGNPMRKALLRTLKILLPLALLAYFIQAYIDFETFLSLAAKTDIAPVILYFAILLASRWAQAVQTRIAMCENGVSVKTAEVFRAQLIANYYTMFVPGDIVGGGVTWYLLQRGRSAGPTIAIVLVYVRLVLLASALAFAAVGLLLESRLHSPSLFLALSLLSVVTAVATAPLVSRSAAASYARLFSAISRRLTTRIEKAQRLFGTALDAVQRCAASSRRSTLSVFGLSAGLHLLGAIGLWLAAYAAHANAPLHAFFWIWPLMIVVHMLPISFGGLGVREFTLIYVMGALYGTTAESVLLLSLIALVGTTLFGLAGGILSSMQAVRDEDETRRVKIDQNSRQHR